VEAALKNRQKRFVLDGEAVIHPGLPSVPDHPGGLQLEMHSTQTRHAMKLTRIKNTSGFDASCVGPLTCRPISAIYPRLKGWGGNLLASEPAPKAGATPGCCCRQNPLDRGYLPARVSSNGLTPQPCQPRWIAPKAIGVGRALPSRPARIFPAPRSIRLCVVRAVGTEQRQGANRPQRPGPGCERDGTRRACDGSATAESLSRAALAVMQICRAWQPCIHVSTNIG
jgi:hypothetical protein